MDDMVLDTFHLFAGSSMNLITLKEAKENSLTRYFTGKECPNGHISERSVNGRYCIECHSDIAKIYYQNNKESKLISARKYRENNKSKIKEYYDLNKIELTKKARKIKQNLKEKLFSMYGDKCALCDFSDKRALSLDHIKNNGSLERSLLGEFGVLKKAASKYAPDEYRTLCMNCQFICHHEFRSLWKTSQ